MNKKNPGIREKVFLSGKAYSTDPIVMQEQLNTILKDNEISFIDFLAIHPVDNVKALTNDVRKWVEKVKIPLLPEDRWHPDAEAG